MQRNIASFAWQCGNKTALYDGGTASEAFDQEGSMCGTKFTDEEVAAFDSWFQKTRKWSYWRRLCGERGEDVLELGLEDNRLQTLKVARSEGFGYMVTGFGGWGLTVCEEFSELLAILTSYEPPSSKDGRQPAALSLAG